MSGRLPAWLSEWVGVSAPTNADGATWQFDSKWSWAPWATLLLVLIAVGWTIALYSRESGNAGRAYRSVLVALRLAALAIVLIMLAQWAIAFLLTGPPSLALVIDRSASMAITDHYNESPIESQLNQRLAANGLTSLSRLNLAKLLAKENKGQLVNRLVDGYRLSVYLVDDNIERLPPTLKPEETVRAVDSLTATGVSSQTTRLGDALERVLEDAHGNPPTAAILLTDGVVTKGASLDNAGRDLRNAGVPLFAIGLGSTEPPRDIELADVLVDDVVFVNDVIRFEAKVKATGLAGQPAKITLRRAGVEQPLQEQTVALPASGKTLTVEFMDRPTAAGQAEYTVEVAPRGDETNKTNNRLSRTVSVRDAKIRVLLAYGYPSYEFRFLKSLLDRDPTVKLSSYLQDADPEYAEQDKTAIRSFPLSSDELFNYDVLILGDIDPRSLPPSAWQNVKSFVSEKGGGVVFIGGPKYFPAMYRDNASVAALLPIDMQTLPAMNSSQVDPKRGAPVRPTVLGLQSAAMQLGASSDDTAQIWARLAPVYWSLAVGNLKPGTQVLAEIAGKPAFCFQFVGAGRVLFHTIDSTWRWRADGGARFFARYWIQAIRFLAHGRLANGQGMELTTDRREYRRGEPVRIRVRFLDTRLAPSGDKLTILINALGQARRHVSLRRNPTAPSVYDGELTDLTAGDYDALMLESEPSGKNVTARFKVVDPPGEFARTEMDAEALRGAAEATHGKFYTIADADQLLADLPVGRRVPIQNLPPVSIWNRWWLLTAFLACLTSEWILRKRKGML
jgi:uncharacterized membrane protein